MARKFIEELSEWTRGAITDTTPDKCPVNASPRALNVAYINLGFPSKRKGCSIITQTGEACAPAMARPAILALGNFQPADTNYNWTISDNGRWSKIVSGVFAPIDATQPYPFTSGLLVPSTAIAKGYLFAVNGTDAFKTNGTVIQKFGLAAPPAATVVDDSVAGNPDGTYYIGLTAYNPTSGHESSLTAVNPSVTVTGSKIKVTFPVTAFTYDTQATIIRVHIFKEGLTDRFFQLTDTDVTPDAGSYDSTNGGWTSATAYVVVDVTDADINNLIIQSPTTTENNPPPSGTTFIAFHKSRMFATDGVDLYFSKVDDPESFDPNNVQHVNPNDGQKIISFSSDPDGTLIILKEFESFVLGGPDDPATWEIWSLDSSIGNRASRTVVKTENAIWWAAEQGFFKKPTGGVPTRMDTASIGNRTEFLNFSHHCVAAYDVIHQRILFGVRGEGDTNNTQIFPYNTRLNIWEDTWDPMDVSALGTFIDPNTSNPYVALGGYGGRVFRMWDTPYLDGVREANDSGDDAFTLKGHPTAADAMTLTDEGATFDTTGDGLAFIPVVVVAPDGSTQRNIIASNTGTVLTLASSWGVIPDATWTYYIGCPNMEFDTKYLAPTSNPTSEGSPFYSRNFKHIMAKGISDTGSALLDIYAIIDGVTNPFAGHVQVLLEGAGALFDIDKWDVGIFGTGKYVAKHVSLGKHGRVCGLRVVNREPSVGVVILGLGVMGTELGYKG